MYIIQNKETKQYLYKQGAYKNHWTAFRYNALIFKYRLEAWSVFKDDSKYQLWKLVPEKVTYSDALK